VNCRDPQPEFVPPPGRRQFCYLGSLHKDRFIKEMVAAAQNIDGRLVIAGPRTKHSFYDWLKTAGGPKVQFLGYVTPEKFEFVMRESDIVLSMVDPANKNNQIGLANKVFDAMTIGRPVIATTGTATGNLVTNLQMGITTMYDQDAFAEGVKTLLGSDDLERLGKNAYDACKNGPWNWQTQAKKFVAVFDGLR
jgi:glycosyltransferase involved in cell wall biosynthesis